MKLSTAFFTAATILTALTLAIAKEGARLGRYEWAVPYLAVLLIVCFLLGTWSLWREKQHVPLRPDPPFSQVIKQEANPQINQTVIVHRDAPIAPQRSPAEQFHHDKAKAFLEKRGVKFVEALRHLHTHGDLTYSSVGVTMHTTWPKGMNRDEAIPIYDACAAEGLVTIQEVPGMHPARKVFIAPAMTNVLSELIYGQGKTFLD